jgi:4-diphosphocytidyl-2-C-methyl-D-erythritol kinase
MILYPNAKINLGLRILRKREDGFHDIESIMIPVPIYDIIEISESVDFSYIQTGIDIPSNGSLGLVERAYMLMKDRYGIGPVAIHLRKQIPIGAGLGGGSADAAFTIKGLNEWFDLGLPTETLEHLAAELGSDCPFFIANQPALAKGRGEELHPMNVNLSGLYIAIYNPGIHVSTASAYGSIVPNPMHSIDYQIKALHEWQAYYVNDFEKPVALAHPEISEGIEYLTEKGAFYAAMSGSGSSYLGIFENPPSNLTTNGLLYVGPVSLSN